MREVGGRGVQRHPINERRPAGEGGIGTGIVAGAIVVNAADQNVFVSEASEAREVFSNPNARDVGRDGRKLSADSTGGQRLRVKGIEMTGTAELEEQDDI